MKLIEALNWRYATKKMNGKAVAQDKVDAILAAAHLAPTSAGLQPFEVIVVRNPELRKQILPIANSQQQVVDGSHLLVFAVWDNYTEERIDRYFDHIRAERNLPASALEDFRQKLRDIFLPRPAEVNFEHAARQAYIAFGLAIAAAAELEVDATPMEGFNGPELDKLLGLDKKGLRSVTILPLGYRDEAQDWLVNQKKVRTPKERFITELN